MSPTTARLRLAAKRLRSRSRTVEALVLVGVAAAAQKWVPMPRWSPLLGRQAAVPDQWRGQAVETLPVAAGSLTESRVAGSVRRASQLLPWEPTCLAQATAGQIMLRRRGEPGQVVIGLRRPDDADRPWDAHAWLLGTRGALTGGPAAAGFTATTVFVPTRPG